MHGNCTNALEKKNQRIKNNTSGTSLYDLRCYCTKLFASSLDSRAGKEKHAYTPAVPNKVWFLNLWQITSVQHEADDSALRFPKLKLLTLQPTA